jgi:hypothetical protein
MLLTPGVPTEHVGNPAADPAQRALGVLAHRVESSCPCSKDVVTRVEVTGGSTFAGAVLVVAETDATADPPVLGEGG